MKNDTCKNCGESVNGNFCSMCGQKINTGRFSFHNIFEEVFHAFTHADKGFFVVLGQLAINPGKVAREYIIEGKRKKYFNLFTFFVLITAISAFIESNSLAMEEKIFHNGNEYGRLFNVYSKLFVLATIPLTAGILWLVNPKKNNISYSEYTVFSMILMSVNSLANIIVKSVSYLSMSLFHKFSDLDNHLSYLLFLICFMAYANYEFHKGLKSHPLYASMLAGIGFCLVQILLSLFVVWAIIRQFDGLGIFTTYGLEFGR